MGASIREREPALKRTTRYYVMQRTDNDDQRAPRHTQHTNTDSLVKQHSNRNIHIAFIVLILIRKIINIKNYIKNETTVALFEVKLLKNTKSIILILKLRWHSPLGPLVARVIVRSGKCGDPSTPIPTYTVVTSPLPSPRILW